MSGIIAIMESVTVNSTLRFRPRFQNLAVLALLAAANAANAAGPAAQLPPTPAMLGHLAILPQITAVFPAIGLLVAAWATQHVRRRNARQLAANKQ